LHLNQIKKNEAIEENAAKIQTENIKSDSKDDTQLIAVITAALAAYLGTPISSIKVGTIRKYTKKPHMGYGIANLQH
jgi:hypothetical protein